MPARNDKSGASEAKHGGIVWGIGLVSGIVFYALGGGGVATYLFTHDHQGLAGVVFGGVVIALAAFLLAKARKS